MDRTHVGCHVHYEPNEQDTVRRLSDGTVTITLGGLTIYLADDNASTELMRLTVEANVLHNPFDTVGRHRA